MALSPASRLAGFARDLLSGNVVIGGASTQGKITLRKASGSVSDVMSINEGSTAVAGNHVVSGNATVGGTFGVTGNATIGGTTTFNGPVNFTGTVNEVTQTNLSVKNKNFSVNEGSTTALADGSGMQVLGDTDAIVAGLYYNSTANRFGQFLSGVLHLFVDVDSTQTLTNKTLTAPTISGATLTTSTLNNPTINNGTVTTQLTTDSSPAPASTAFVKNVVAAIPAVTPIFLRRQALTGTQDGTNATFTLPNAIIAGTEQIFVNGVLQKSTTNYTLTNPTSATPTLTLVNVGDSVTTVSASDTLEAFGVS